MTDGKPRDEAGQRPSKTQRKREMLELQTLGEQLIDLPDEFVAALPVPVELLEAIREARKMTKRGALHRQKQFIGRLMRDIDAEPVRRALEDRRMAARRAAARFHVVEKWRDRLLEDGDAAFAELLDVYPQTDRQHVRRLMRDAVGERDRNKPPRAARQLFRYLDTLME